MTNLQKLTLRLSEIRQRLNEIAGLEGDALTEEIRAEADRLGKEYRDKETQHRAALIAEGEAENRAAQGFEAGDGTSAEIRSIRRRASLGRYLNRAMAGNALDGAEAELNAALEVRSGGGTAIPWAMLTPAAPEVRADAVTDTSALDGGTAQRPILPRLFGPGILDALGVRIDSVPAGMSEWPILTGGAAPAQTAEKAGKDADPAAFSTQALKPKRLTGRYRWTAEQSAQVADLEAALRRDLADAVKAKMSDQAINGDGADANVTGLLTRLAAPADPAAESGYSDYAGAAALGVDGIHATAEGEVSCLLGVKTYQHAASKFQDGSGESGTEALKKRSRACLATSYIPAPAANDQAAILHAGADAMRGDSIAAVWPTMEVIRDIYSGAAKGETILTWVVLWDAYTAFRGDAYKRLRFQLAA